MAGSLINNGLSRWRLVRDSNGHREYEVQHKVMTDDALDGPATVLTTVGLPQIGDTWNFGNDIDIWAFCWPDATVDMMRPRSDGEKTNYWVVTQKFSTKPLSRCQDNSIEDPLLEPMGISGTFVKYTIEAAKDMNGEPIMSSSHEPFRGPQVEFDANRPTVTISQNIAVLGLATFAAMVDTVNDRELWGLDPRMVKLSNVSWERKLYGVCDFYFTRIFDFDIDFTTFDRILMDEGTKVLHGHWDIDAEAGTGTGCDGDTWVLTPICGADPDKNNPQHFSRFKDRNGENIRAILDGNGLPANTTVQVGTSTDTTGDAGEIEVKYYQESNLELLGIPTDLETGA